MLPSRYYNNRILKSILNKVSSDQNHKKCNLSNYFLKKSVSKNFVRAFGSNPQFNVEEIVIPNGKKYSIACKAWKVPGKSVGPPIICVHGWLDNANSFDALIPKIMGGGRTVYAFDLPGHGLSSHYDMTHYNSHTESHLSIHRLVRHLKLDKVTLIGHSMGAEGCAMFAATHPQFVDKLVTMDGVNPKLADWVFCVRVFADGIFETEKTLAKESPPESTKEELLGRMLKARAGNVTEAGCRRLLERAVSKLPSGKYAFSHDLKLRIPPGMALMETSQMSQFCAAIKAPICVIKAKDTDPFSDQPSKDFVTAMKAGKESNPDLKLDLHYVDGNHHVHLNEPDNVASIINQFLDS